MSRPTFTCRLLATFFTAMLLSGQLLAAAPSVASALKLKPLQAEVDYDTPEGEAVDQCSIEPINSSNLTGWEVKNGNGQVLRQFVDSNGDKKVDQWRYYKDGIEIYRDIDSNYNGKADQYRWLGTSGTRWGIDQNEDGRVDAWKVISPEELTAEVVAALRDRDAARLQCLLLTSDELKSLGLGKTQAEQLQAKIAAAAAGAETLNRRQQFVDETATWVNFGGVRPGVVPAGTDGSQRDLVVYENVSAMISSGDEHGQVIIGTLVRLGDAWRLIDLPRSLIDAQANTAPEGFFFTSELARRDDSMTPQTGGLSPEVQQLLGDLENIDKDLASPQDPAALARLNAQRADLLVKLADNAKDAAEKATWIRQLADTVSAAVQSGGYPDGIKRLESLEEDLQSKKADKTLIAYVKFRSISAAYTQQLQSADVDFSAVQDKWNNDLEQFVKDFPESPDAAEAMLQLAIAKEFSGKDDEAVEWYERITKDFGSLPVAKKATGAKLRIESVGKTISLNGTSLQGQPWDLASQRGKVVIIHYWATWCEPCKQDLSVLKVMQAEYGKENLALVGVNVDNQRSDAEAFLAENPLSWPQLYEPGGLDSRLSNELGVLTLPTMLMVDKEGKVISRNLHSGEIDRELRTLLR
jgi:thiol-disulfide isomerase/thioredoxin